MVLRHGGDHIDGVQALPVVGAEDSVERLDTVVEIEILETGQTVQVEVGAEGTRYQRSQIKVFLVAFAVEFDQLDAVLVEAGWNELVLFDEIGYALVICQVIFERRKVFV